MGAWTRSCGKGKDIPGLLRKERSHGYQFLTGKWKEQSRAFCLAWRKELSFFLEVQPLAEISWTKMVQPYSGVPAAFLRSAHGECVAVPAVVPPPFSTLPLLLSKLKKKKKKLLRRGQELLENLHSLKDQVNISPPNSLKFMTVWLWGKITVWHQYKFLKLGCLFSLNSTSVYGAKWKSRIK